jgi:hypothetical protein
VRLESLDELLRGLQEGQIPPDGVVQDHSHPETLQERCEAPPGLGQGQPRTLGEGNERRRGERDHDGKALGETLLQLTAALVLEKD